MQSLRIRRLRDRLRQGGAVLCDGAWGTELMRLGLQPGDCPERWNLERPDIVRSIARAYAEAGAEVVETNSFGANRIKLVHHGLADRCSEINERAAQLSREGAGEDRWISGSVGPTGKLLMMEEITEDELADVFREQVTALERGGADLICVETMSAIDEAAIAVRAARAHTACVVCCTFVFEPTAQGDYRTMMGVSPEEAAAAVLEAGAEVIGANCGKGSHYMTVVIRRLRAAHPGVPILVQANAGSPKLSPDGTMEFPESPEEMASRVPEWLEAGANLIGGCCGTSPAHIRAMAAALARACRSDRV